MLHITPIATVRSCFAEKFGVPRQPGLCPSAYGTLVFEPAFRSQEAIRGIEGFSHLWLVFGFHETADRGWSPTVRPPRLGGNERVGVFASRSTFRPNGLGLSLIKLERIETHPTDGPVLHLSGIDLIDRTPVFDIKPYLGYAEAIPNARSGFAADAIPRLAVEISDAARPAFHALPARDQQVIREALALDPRPPAGANEPGRRFGTRMCGMHVHFTVVEATCVVLSVSAD
ncbi:MAG: tRNA (N6-threonylcarbamoyladenosine(37)-N6)-methyltransferase TrmO [Verrucomicrobiota bacterium]